MLLTKNFALSPSHYFFSSVAIFLQDQTSLAMQHIILLKMPSARVADMSGSVADLARSNSKRKKADFADMVAECQQVIGAWIVDVDAYISQEREQPESPFQEIEYWRRRMSALTSIENQLRQKGARAVQIFLSKSPIGVMDLQNWKPVDLKLTEAKNEARDNLKYLLTLERYLAPLAKDNPQAMVDGMPPIMNAIKMIHTVAR